MIIWINGAFGAGKTETANALHQLVPDSFVYDPENAGYYIRASLPAALQLDDFQHHAEWREINYMMLLKIAQSYSGLIIVPMTVVNPVYYEEIIGRLRTEGVNVQHFTLRASREVLLQRLEQRGDGRESWPALQIDRCMEGLSSSIFERHIDTDNVPTDVVVNRIIDLAGLS